MRKMTEENLRAAFAGESQAFMKYTIFAEVAEKEGFKNAAKLFRAIAYAEKVHAANHLRELGEIGTTVENLQKAIGGENFEVDEMYPAYYAVAELQEEKGALRSFRFALEAEKIHEEMFSEAKEKVSSGSDIDVDAVYVCPVCGHTAIGEAPEKCPVCGMPKEKYVEFK